jgi:hypothetical protein
MCKDLEVPEPTGDNKAAVATLPPPAQSFRRPPNAFAPPQRPYIRLPDTGLSNILRDVDKEIKELPLSDIE